ncbi:cell division cycle protein 123 family protein [Paracoccus onubensis]|uniref:ATP-grasp domain-containing protein n=1 Tax=Paracoccus onubensis TaxID=1675788 RepID=A0A418SNP3_9RHOB|nr:hypothetical protein [Paracoccus onubensis]RJE82568.1 hypothetical protein D3P04_19600 [Paracoccus onubensis]
MSYDDSIELTFAENWPAEIRAISMPMGIHYLNQQDIFALSSSFETLRNEFNIPKVLDFSLDIEEFISGELEKYPKGIFIKTSYGMFKQNPFAYSPIFSMRDFNSNVRWPDHRIENFLRNRLKFRSPFCISASPWVDIHPGTEFRIFISDRQNLGVSQYHCNQFYKLIHEDLKIIKASLASFSSRLVEVLHMDSVVADVFVHKDADGKCKTTLIELNPFNSLTDPCLFSWVGGGDFDGTFRYVSSDFKKQHVEKAVRYSSDEDPWHLPAEIGRRM